LPSAQLDEMMQMYDGAVRSATADIVVTLGACIEEFWSN
jgi:hypothetical protein